MHQLETLVSAFANFKLWDDKGQSTPKNKTIFNLDNESSEMKFMELYSSKMMGEQLNKYTDGIKIIENQTNITDVTYYGKMLQISNCVFPVNSEDIDDCYGTNGLRNCFKINQRYFRWIQY